MTDRVFRLMGLNGKAVLPMVLGLGCDTMATLTTRILPTRKERLIAMLLLALGVPCSAQLGVILAMLGGGAVRGRRWSGSRRSAAVMIPVGWLAARVLPGERGAFVVELPPMRLPALGNMLLEDRGARRVVPEGGAAALPGRHLRAVPARPAAAARRDHPRAASRW